MANNRSTPDAESVRRALESARNSEDGRVNPEASTLLEVAIEELWRKIQARPDTYVLTRDEFSLFNYFLRERFRDSPIARSAVERYWRAVQGGNPPGIDGSAHPDCF
jgi:hypothetical protein